MKEVLTPEAVNALWRALDRRMRHAAWSAVALLVITALFLIFLDRLWKHPYEWLWAALLGLLTFHLLVAQWRIAGFNCPRCGGSWLESLWRLPNPFALYRSRCPHCGLEKDAEHW